MNKINRLKLFAALSANTRIRIESSEEILQEANKPSSAEDPIILDIQDTITGADGPLTLGQPGDTETYIVLESSNGSAIDGANTQTSLVVTGANTTVTIGPGITITNGQSVDGGGITITDKATVILDGGTITGNKSTIAEWERGGGAVNILDGTFIMNSGSITGNAALRGAGVFVSSIVTANPSTFIMNGGSIDNNSTVIGAVEAEAGARDTGGGGAIFAFGPGAEVILNGGEIRANSASRMGSAITLSTGASLELNDSLITENVGPWGVVGTAGSGCTVKLFGGRIENNFYGPLNADGTPNEDLISNTDGNGTISKWVRDIEYGIVEEHAAYANIEDPEVTYIEGAAPLF